MVGEDVEKARRSRNNGVGENLIACPTAVGELEERPEVLREGEKEEFGMRLFGVEASKMLAPNGCRSEAV